MDNTDPLAAYVLKVTPDALALYVYLRSIAVTDRQVIVSLSEIAQSLMKSVRYVQKYLGELEEEGMIEREQRTGEHGERLASLYRLKV